MDGSMHFMYWNIHTYVYRIYVDSRNICKWYNLQIDGSLHFINVH